MIISLKKEKVIELERILMFCRRFHPEFKENADAILDVLQKALINREKNEQMRLIDTKNSLV